MDLDSETLLLAIRFGHCSAVHAATLREAGGAWALYAVWENEALRAEVKRLRAIEAAARDAMRQIDRALWDTGCLHDLRNNARICELRAALAAKETP
jgi:hypothetical protein